MHRTVLLLAMLTTIQSAGMVLHQLSVTSIQCLQVQ